MSAPRNYVIWPRKQENLRNFQLPNSNIPDEIKTLLFTSWVQYLSVERFKFTQYGSGGSTYNFGDPTKQNFVLECSQNADWSLKSSQGVPEKDIDALVTAAMENVAAGNFGGDIVYQATVQAKGFELNLVSMSNFARLLGDQVPIAGPRRLSDRVLLDFLLDLPAGTGVLQPFVHQTNINVTVFVPGPTASDLTQEMAAGMMEVVAALCALALGSVVEVPLVVFPAEVQEAADAQERRHDPAILGLARESVSLDVFGEFSALGGADGFLRVRGALLSYHSALQQANPDVALMLLVSALQALIVPRPEWRKEKATKRFIDAINCLCPEVVDTLVSHANVEHAFAYKRRGGPRARRRQLLNQIYELRSNPTHSGIGLSGAGMLSLLVGPSTMRVAMLSDLARGALLSFLQAPRSSLIGHPMFDQAIADQ